MHFQGGNSVEFVLHRNGKGPILQQKKSVLPSRANSLSMKKTPLQKEICVQESKRQLTKVVSLVRNGGILITYTKFF